MDFQRFTRVVLSQDFVVLNDDHLRVLSVFLSFSLPLPSSLLATLSPSFPYLLSFFSPFLSEMKKIRSLMNAALVTRPA